MKNTPADSHAIARVPIDAVSELPHSPEKLWQALGRWQFDRAANKILHLWPSADKPSPGGSHFDLLELRSQTFLLLNQSSTQDDVKASLLILSTLPCQNRTESDRRVAASLFGLASAPSGPDLMDVRAKLLADCRSFIPSATKTFYSDVKTDAKPLLTEHHVTLLSSCNDVSSTSTALAEIARSGKELGAFWWRYFDVVADGLSSHLTEAGTISLKDSYILSAENYSTRIRSTRAAAERVVAIMEGE